MSDRLKYTDSLSHTHSLTHKEKKTDRHTHTHTHSSHSHYSKKSFDNLSLTLAFTNRDGTKLVIALQAKIMSLRLT